MHQNDVLEKGKQVHQMRDVYSEQYNASRMEAKAHLKDMDHLALQGIKVDTIRHSGQVLNPESSIFEWYHLYEVYYRITGGRV
jgi:hypothetical protein